MTTVEELVEEQSEDTLKAGLFDDLVSLGAQVTSWKSGSVTRVIIAAVARALQSFSRTQANLARSAFLDFAEDDWLTLVAKYVYDIDRDLGSFATGSVVVSNTTGSLYTGGPETLIFLNPSNGATYRNTQSYTINPLQSNLTIPVEAITIGSAGSSLPGEITELETTLLGVTVTNPAALIGSDATGDEALRILCRERTAAASPNGPGDAYSYFAKTATRADDSSVGVTRVLPVPLGSGLIDVYVATATGGVQGVNTDISTDLGVIQDQIVSNVEPIGVVATVRSAAALAINVTYELWMLETAGISIAETQAAVQSSLEEFISSQPIGGQVIGASARVWKRAIEQAIGDALPEGTFVNIAVTEPLSDVTVAFSQAPVIGTVTATAINLVTDA